MEKIKRYSEMQRNNWATLFCYTMIDVILILCYLIEVIKKSRTIGYFAVFSLLALIPLVITHIIYRKDPESEYIKSVTVAGFGIFYYFVIFTTTSPLAYVYAIILSMVLISYNTIRTTIFSVMGIFVGNVIQVGYALATHQISTEEMPTIEIRLASIVIFGLYMIIATIVTDLNSKKKIMDAQEEKDKADGMARSLIDASEQITKNIVLVTEKMQMLEESTSKTMHSMEEVAKGTGDTAESIQLQMQQTEEIQKTIEHVSDASSNIDQDMSDTMHELINTKENIDDLIKHVEQSNEENGHVADELAELSEYTNQMKSIIVMIDEITSQTSLLSLNASIEAARAGEAGRGFAVVASEISTLATQTQSATDKITALINNIFSKLDQVVEVIGNMIENSKEQNAVANNTAESFNRISQSVEDVYKESGKLKQLVRELDSANDTIVQGIETISAATEEVNAHSSETLESSEENEQITKEVSGIIDELNNMAKQLAV